MPETKKVITKESLLTWRETEGLTQAEAAEELGVHVQAYRAWEQKSHARQVPYRLTTDPRFRDYITVERNGQAKLVSEWVESFGLTLQTLHLRMSHGWSFELALTTPVQKRKRRKQN